MASPLLLTPLFAGLLTGFSLIAAIGAQNAFVLRQGLAGRHVAAVVAFCAIADLLLINAGVGGLAVAVAARPSLLMVVHWVGATFLVAYGLRSAWSARRPSHVAAAERTVDSRKAAVLTVAGLTVFNPHVYLDVVLLGTLAAAYGATGRWWFGAGATVASVVWFCGIGFGARLLQPVFARPVAWQVLDGIIAVIMFTLGISLVVT